MCNIIFKSSRPETFCKKDALKNLAKFTGKHLCQSLFLKKETLVQLFSCEFCEIFKNAFFYRTPPLAASAISLLFMIVFLETVFIKDIIA